MKTLFCILLLLVTPLFAIPPLSIISTTAGYRIAMDVPKPVITAERINTVSSYGDTVNETFVKTFIYGFDYDGTPGEPLQLTGSFSLAFEGDDPAVELEHVETESIPLSGKLYPVQPPYFYDGSHKQPAFVYNPQAYEQSVFGNPVSVARTFMYRGQRVAQIEVSPLSYDPETNTVTVIRRMELSVTMTKPSVVRSLGSRDFDAIMRALFPNLEGVPPEPFTMREKYLIIAEPTYLDNADLKRFVEYRSTQYDVKLVSTAALRDTTKEAFRRFIFYKEKPTFCLLVGSSFPAWETCSWKSLNYYVASQVSSPYQRPFPSIALGLFWITHPAQLTNIVNKTIATERTLALRPKIVLGQGGNTCPMGALPEEHCDNTIQEINSRYFPGVSGFTAYSYPSIPGGAQRAIDQFNSGCWFNLYNGHGSVFGQAMGWGMGNLFAMKNTMYPFVLTCACLTGTFDQNCVAAVSVGFPTGPVTYIGAYDNSSIGQHVLNQGYPEAIMEKNITKNGLAFVYGVNYDSTPRAISFYSGQVSSGSRALMAWQYHHFGDPAIETMHPARVPPFICITSPKSDDRWEQTATAAIRWRDNLSGNVTIELYKGRLLQSTIAASTESDGVFDWSVPAWLPPGNDYRIYIRSVNSGTVRDSSASFGIVEPYIIQPPYTMSFDELDSGAATLPVHYEQSSSDDLDWSVWHGSLACAGTAAGGSLGPVSDHTSGYGKYLYVRSPDSGDQARVAEFMTPSFYLPASGYHLSFWVYMTSKNRSLGSLALDVCVDGVWRTLPALLITGDQGPQWQERTVTLDPYRGARVRFRFRAMTGSPGGSIICMDDLHIEASVSTAGVATAARFTPGMSVEGDRIHFAVPVRSIPYPIAMVLYDAQGKAVRTLYHGTAVHGSVSLSRQRIPSGFYVVVLQGSEYRCSTTLVVSR